MESAQEELPQLHTSNDRQDEVNDRVETYRQSVMRSESNSIKWNIQHTSLNETHCSLDIGRLANN